MNLQGKTCLFASAVDYNALKQRHQFLAAELANLTEVIYLNPLRNNGFKITVNNENKNLKTVTVTLPIKAFKIPLFQNILTKIVFFMLTKKLKLNIANSILWISEPSYAALARYNFKCIIYDKCDLHGAFPGQKESVWQKYEQFILKNSDIVFITHKYLTKSLSSNTYSVLLPNAAPNNLPLFAKSLQKRKSKSKIVNLISSGAHYEWINADWLKIFTELQGVKLHIAGPVRNKEVSKLIEYGTNIVYHGILPHNDLIALLGKCHIGLVPFKDIKLINAVDPVKVYEYAAMNLQVWASETQSTINNRFVSRIIKNQDDALKALNDFKKCKKPFLNNNMVPTWKKRIQTVLDSLKKIE